MWIPSSPIRRGLIYGVVAYGLWGVIPVYFKLTAAFSSLEVAAHRVVWTCIVVWLYRLCKHMRGHSLFPGRGGEFSPLSALGSLFLISNWLLFIWCIANDNVIQVSLGYFLNPLITALLGVLVLREGLSRTQVFAFAIAGSGFVYLLLSYHEFPTYALGIAVSFSLYALVSKLAKAEATSLLAGQMTMLFPLALLYLMAIKSSPPGSSGSRTLSSETLLATTGIVTIVPLLLFLNAARRLPLSLLGILEYITPTCQLILAVVVYHERLSAVRCGAFVCAWISLCVYTADRMRGQSITS